ncbi:hypothetical protein ACT3RR_21795, partial [Ewingella sp. AOP8-B2-18]
RSPLFLIFPTRSLRDVVHVVPCRWSGIIGIPVFSTSVFSNKMINCVLFHPFVAILHEKLIFSSIPDAVSL